MGSRDIAEQSGLIIRNMWQDDKTLAVEIDIQYTIKCGAELKLPQVLIIESEDGQVIRWQSYLPFPPTTSEQPVISDGQGTTTSSSGGLYLSCPCTGRITEAKNLYTSVSSPAINREKAK